MIIGQALHGDKAQDFDILAHHLFYDKVRTQRTVQALLGFDQTLCLMIPNQDHFLLQIYYL